MGRVRSPRARTKGKAEAISLSIRSTACAQEWVFLLPWHLTTNQNSYFRQVRGLQPHCQATG